MSRLRPARVDALHDALGDAAMSRVVETRLGRYVAGHGSAHLMRRDRDDEAVALLTDFDWLYRRLQHLPPATAKSLPDEYGALALRLERDHRCRRDMQLWAGWASGCVDVLSQGTPRWPASRVLLQCAWEHAEESPVTRAAERWLETSGFDDLWMRRATRPQRAELHTLAVELRSDQGALVGALAVDDATVLAWTDWGEILTYCARTGDLLLCHKAHDAPINGVKRVPDSPYLLSWCDLGRVVRHRFDGELVVADEFVVARALARDEGRSARPSAIADLVVHEDHAIVEWKLLEEEIEEAISWGDDRIVTIAGLQTKQPRWLWRWMWVGATSTRNLFLTAGDFCSVTTKPEGIAVQLASAPDGTCYDLYCIFDEYSPVFGSHAGNDVVAVDAVGPMVVFAERTFVVVFCSDLLEPVAKLRDHASPIVGLKSIGGDANAFVTLDDAGNAIVTCERGGAWAAVERVPAVASIVNSAPRGDVLLQLVDGALCRVAVLPGGEVTTMRSAATLPPLTLAQPVHEGWALWSRESELLAVLEADGEVRGLGRARGVTSLGGVGTRRVLTVSAVDVRLWRRDARFEGPPVLRHDRRPGQGAASTVEAGERAATACPLLSFTDVVGGDPLKGGLAPMGSAIKRSLEEIEKWVAAELEGQRLGWMVKIDDTAWVALLGGRPDELINTTYVLARERSGEHMGDAPRITSTGGREWLQMLEQLGRALQKELGDSWTLELGLFRDPSTGEVVVPVVVDWPHCMFFEDSIFENRATSHLIDLQTGHAIRFSSQACGGGELADHGRVAARWCQRARAVVCEHPTQGIARWVSSRRVDARTLTVQEGRVLVDVLTGSLLPSEEDERVWLQLMRGCEPLSVEPGQARLLGRGFDGWRRPAPEY